MLPGGEGSVPGIEIIPGGRRENVYCPSCYSTDKERLLFKVFKKLGLFDTAGERLSVLHFAPEKNIKVLLSNNPRLEYITGDITPGRAMKVIDITEITFPNAFFDAILCSHVLEHIIDDTKAMRELHRVLKTGGFAVLQVPLSLREETFEDPSVTSFEDRERIFGQGDHVRIYGKDYKNRLENAGFTVEWKEAQTLFGTEEVRRSGINPAETVIIVSPK
jgi:SAM-dependent methyltransferase